MNANFADLRISLENLDFSFDEIALTETWLSESIDDFYPLEGYDFCHINGNTKHGGFFIKSNVNYAIIDQLKIDVENCLGCITVKLLLKMQTIVSCLYRNQNSTIADFTDYIESMFNSMKGSIYLCGDFDIDLLNYNVNNNSKYFADQMFTMYSLPLINKATHITHQCYSIIDDSYTNSINEDIASGGIIADISDHFPTFSIVHHGPNKKRNRKSYLWAHSQENISKLNCLLALESLHLVFSANDVNYSYNTFVGIFMRHYNLCCPIKEHRSPKI